MAQRMIVQKLTRLTLVRKGRATAKHPDMREGVVEAIKSSDEVLDTPVDTGDDWYSAFDTFVLDTTFGESDDPLELFSAAQKESASKQRKNYPDSEGPFAGPHNSFPIRNAQDVIHAAMRLHNAGGNQAKIKARIIAIAHAHGYPLPKSWGGKSKVSALEPNELIEAIRALLDGEVEVQKSQEETPEAPETPAQETPSAPTAEGEEDAEKASRNSGHSHAHVHSSMRGYEYSHTHPHGDDAHVNMADHDTSETAHAHEHVAKAGDSPDVDGLLADNAGLAQDLEAAQSEVEALKAEVARLSEKASDAEKKAARKPLTAPAPKQSSAEPVQITTNMSFNDAFDKLMGRNTPLQ